MSGIGRHTPFIIHLCTIFYYSTPPPTRYYWIFAWNPGIVIILITYSACLSNSFRASWKERISESVLLGLLLPAQSFTVSCRGWRFISVFNFVKLEILSESESNTESFDTFLNSFTSSEGLRSLWILPSLVFFFHI